MAMEHWIFSILCVRSGQKFLSTSEKGIEQLFNLETSVILVIISSVLKVSLGSKSFVISRLPVQLSLNLIRIWAEKGSILKVDFET